MAGDLLLCVRGSTTGRTNIAGFDAAIGRGVASIHSHLYPAYLDYYIVSQREAIFSLGTGSTFPNITTARLFEFPVPVAPLDEQSRIVAKINELFSDLDSSLEAMERAKTNVERYRSAIVNDAVEGRLTEEWRRDHPNVEPASDLLKRILVERRSKWEADKVTEYEVTGRKPPKRWKDTFKEPAGPDASELPKLPKEWCWVSLDQLLNGIEAGTSFKCLTRPASDDEWGVIKVSAMTRGEFRENENKALPFDRAFDVTKEIRPGDILLSRSNTSKLVGATVLVGKCRSKLLLSDKSLRLLPSEYIDHVWLQKALASQVARRQMSSMATGTSDSMRNVSHQKLLSVALPLMPYAEQVIIRDQIEAKLLLANSMETLIQQSKLRAYRLRQSILQQAFSGKLVPQNPNDQHASELLAKLSELRETQSRKPEPSRGRTHLTMTTQRRPLTDVLKGHPDGLSPERLLVESGRTLEQVEEFYRELRSISENIQEIRPDEDSINRWPAEIQIVLKLRSA